MHDLGLCACPDCPQNSNSNAITHAVVGFPRSRSRSYRNSSRADLREHSCEWCELWNTFMPEILRCVSHTQIRTLNTTDTIASQEYQPTPRDITAAYNLVHRYFRGLSSAPQVRVHDAIRDLARYAVVESRLNGYLRDPKTKRLVQRLLELCDEVQEERVLGRRRALDRFDGRRNLVGWFE